LLERDASLQQGRPGAARRVDRGVGDRDADQVDQGQAEANGDRTEAGRGPLVGGADDHEQEHQGHDHFRDESGLQRVTARRMLAKSVGGQPALVSGDAAGDQTQHHAGNDGAQHLGNHVSRELGKFEAARHGKANRDGRVQVAAGNMPDGKSHRQHGQTKGQRDADKTDSHFRKAGSQHGRPATAEHEPECTDELGYGFLSKRHGSLPPVSTVPLNRHSDHMIVEFS